MACFVCGVFSVFYGALRGGLHIPKVSGRVSILNEQVEHL